jgi:poly(3-hydroxybutyrate) depolymerase
MKTLYKKLFTTAALASLTSAALAQDIHSDDTLPPLSLTLGNVTVSGMSSGGYMATQFHVAHSDWVKGAGILAAGPYYCAKGDITTALAQCVNKVDGDIDLNALQQVAKAFEKEEKIAPLSNLSDAKVWLFHGTQDKRVIAEVNDLLHKQYSMWTDNANLKYISDKPMAHVFPTQSTGVDCMQAESPFIGNCDYDAAGAMLKHLIPSLSAPDDSLSGKLYTLNQQQLAGANAKTLASEGFVYVPEECAKGASCRAHISFHGCNQYAGAVGDAYITQTGINEWADDNKIVVLYPQTQKSLFMPLNPQGCWDWWGYSSSDYANRDGEQIKAVKQMLFALSNDSNTNGSPTTISSSNKEATDD